MSAVFSDDTLEHHCAEGHYWREHTNGQVTPSWGYGGTYLDVADPALCPEPYTDEQGLYACCSCGERHRPGDGLAGMSFTPWEYSEGKRQECEVPVPACGKPAVWTRRWGDRHLPWPNGPGELYSLWRLEHRSDGERLVCYIGSIIKGNGSEAIDLHTGEMLAIGTGDPAWNPAGTRKATVADLPGALRAIWPRRPSPSEGGGVSTPWLLAHTNPDYMALCALREQGLLSVKDHVREFMWAISGARSSGGLEQEIRRCVSERDWQIPDVAALLAAHTREREQLRERNAQARPRPSVQLGLGI
jgi:hypothetical protein